MNILNEYKKFEENNETLITIYFCKKKKEDILLILNKELSAVSNIQNLSKKNKLNNRYYNLKLKIEKLNDESIINSIFLINDDIFEYKFTQKEMNTINEYRLRDFYLKTDMMFHIDYLNDLFTNFEFNNFFHINKNNLKFKKVNKNKYKILFETKFISDKNLIEIINNYILEHKINELLVYGVSSGFKCLKNEKNNKIIINESELDNNSINNIFYRRKYEKNNVILEKKLNELNNENTNLDLFVFGKLKKEILTSIEYYQLKELYIEERKLEKLKQFVDESYLNFTIIPIQVINEGDIASKFIKDYNGLMGIKHY